MGKGASVTGNDRTKVRFVLVEVEGASGAVDSAIRGLTTALQSRPMALPATHPPSLVAKNSNGSETPPPPVVEAGVHTDEDTDEVTPEPGAAAERKPRKQHQSPIIKVDIESDVSLESFVSEKGPDDSNSQRALVLALWFKHHRGVPAIGGSHIRTCFKMMHWPVPVDETSPLRSMKKQGWFDAGGVPGFYAVNDVGETEVKSWAKRS